MDICMNYGADFHNQRLKKTCTNYLIWSKVSHFEDTAAEL